MLEKRTTWLGLLATAAAVALAVFLVAPGSVAQEKMAPTANHYKCYPILDWAEENHPNVALSDQFGKSEAKVLQPSMLCNPVDKNGEGIGDKEDHLVCFQINDDPSGDFDRVKEVRVQNQFGENTLWVGLPGRQLCLPSKKQLVQ